MGDSLAGGFRLGDHFVLPSRGRIVSPAGDDLHVEPRAMEVLVALASRAGETVSRDDLIEAVWKHPHVSDEALSRCISVLRHVLGNGDGRPSLIETVPKRGYRLAVPVIGLERAAGGTRVNGSGPVAGHSVATHGAADPSERTRTNLALQPTPVIGRETELAEIRALLADRRLVTLTGSAGVGKTRLAVEVGRLSLASFPDGVWLVDLAPLSDPTRVAATVAVSLGLEPGHQTTPAALARQLEARTLLLIMDNCEHVIDAVAEQAQSLLGMAPAVRILATSQVPINIAGEQGYRIPPLPVPDEGPRAAHEVRGIASVRLFEERAAAADSHFRIDDRNATAVASVCRWLDGIPLAIEMAAARAGPLGIDELAAMLEARFEILRAGRRTALPRHQTLRATLDWSFGLLAADERTVFARLGVFAGGFTLDAASVIAGDESIAKGELVDLLARLVERSLVVAVPHAGGMRYRLLQTHRLYALERLDASGEAEAIRSRHLAYYLQLVTETAPNVCGPGQNRAFEAVHAERENILAAHAWCDQAPGGGESGMKLALALKDYWVHRGGLEAGYRLTTEALARSNAQDRTLTRAHAEYTAALLASCMQRYHEALGHREACLSIAQELGDERTILFALLSLSEHCSAYMEWPRARRYAEDALALARRRDGKNEVVCALLALGDLDRIEGRLDDARVRYAECLAIARTATDPRHVAVTVLDLMSVELARGSSEQAPERLLEALEIGVRTGSKTLGAYTVLVASGLAAFLAEPALATELHAAATGLLDDIGFRCEPADEAFLAPLIARAHGALSSDELAHAQGRGRVLGYDPALGRTRHWLEALRKG
jgi:non-specific serine/threonine protein kinase